MILLRGCGILLRITKEAFGISSRAGASGDNFLKIDVSARVSAMKEAFTAVADNISSIYYYNPAGLTQINSKTYASSRLNLWVKDVETEFVWLWIINMCKLV